MNPYDPPSGASQEPPIEAELVEKTPLWVPVACWAVASVIYLAAIGTLKYLESINVIPTEPEIMDWLRKVLLNR